MFDHHPPNISHVVTLFALALYTLQMHQRRDEMIHGFMILVNTSVTNVTQQLREKTKPRYHIICTIRFHLFRHGVSIIQTH